MQRDLWNQVRKNWLIHVTRRVVFAITVASVIAIVFRLTSLPPLVPLWYSRPWGTDQLANPMWLFILPASNILMYATNVCLAIFFTAEYLIFTQMIFLTSLLVSLLSFIALIRILYLIG